MRKAMVQEDLLGHSANKNSAVVKSMSLKANHLNSCPSCQIWSLQVNEPLEVCFLNRSDTFSVNDIKYDYGNEN